jgi:hypothetical protein
MRIVLDLDKVLDGYNPSEVIALTFAEAKFNSIVERGGTFSNKINLAKTANNAKHLGFPDDNRETSARPYTLFDCRIELGMPIFYGVAVVEESQDFFVLRIFSGTAAFFDEFGDVDIRDLNFSDLNHAWTSANVYAARNATSNYCYPAINYGRWKNSISSSHHHTDFFPAVFTKRVLEQAALLGGYTVVNADESYALPFAKKDFQNNKTAGARFECSADFNQTLVTLDPIVPLAENFDIVTTDPTDHKFDYEAGAGISYGYELRAGGAYDFRAHIKINNGLTLGSRVQIYPYLFQTSNNSGLKYLGNEQTINWDDPVKDIELDFFINGVEGQANAFFQMGLKTFLTSFSGTLTIKEGSYIECTSAKEPILNGDLIGIADTLPALSVKDLFLFEAVRRNAYILTNTNTKEIRFLPLDEVAAKSPAAKDWSSKVDVSVKPKLTYRLTDYAQLNGLRWAEGVDEDLAYLANPEIGNYNFVIYDGGLKKSKTLFTAKFAFSSLQVSFTDYIHLFIPRYSSTSLNYDEPDIDPKMRICKMVGTTEFAVQISGQSSMGEVRYGIGESWRTLYDENYISFSEIMNKFKMLEVNVNLTGIDIADLDLTTPVRLLGNTWIIRQVEQFAVNKAGSTTVELIRI